MDDRIGWVLAARNESGKVVLNTPTRIFKNRKEAREYAQSPRCKGFFKKAGCPHAPRALPIYTDFDGIPSV